MITIENDKIIFYENQQRHEFDIGTPEAFRILSKLWLRSGFDLKYVYGFTWLGVPLFQLPEDLIRIQEVISTLKPDVIVETGVAHGGSLVFYASLFRMMNHPGKVIGIEIEFRNSHRENIQKHPLFEYIHLVDGNSTDPQVMHRVKSLIKQEDKVMVLLDSNHSKKHVLDELHAYADLVSEGFYMVAMDGIMEMVASSPLGKNDWSWNNPKKAAEEFAKTRSDFILEEPPIPFNEGQVTERVTHWPSGWLRRIFRK